MKHRRKCKVSYDKRVVVLYLKLNEHFPGHLQVYLPKTYNPLTKDLLVAFASGVQATEFVLLNVFRKCLGAGISQSV
jgi:hypothetical protein